MIKNAHVFFMPDFDSFYNLYENFINSEYRQSDYEKFNHLFTYGALF